MLFCSFISGRALLISFIPSCCRSASSGFYTTSLLYKHTHYCPALMTHSRLLVFVVVLVDQVLPRYCCLGFSSLSAEVKGHGEHPDRGVRMWRDLRCITPCSLWHLSRCVCVTCILYSAYHHTHLKEIKSNIHHTLWGCYDQVARPWVLHLQIRSLLSASSRLTHSD